MDWPNETKPLVEKYSRGYAWICLYEDDKTQVKNFEKVNKRLMEMEDEMRSKGVTNDQLGSIIKSIDKLLKKPMDKMTSRELEFTCQIIFGKDAKIVESKLRPTDMAFANGKLATYAYHQKEGNMS